MKRGISLALALALSISSFITVKADELSDAQKDLKNVQNSINDKKEQVEDISKDQKDAQNSLQQLDKKIEATETTLNSLNAKIKGLSSEIEKNEKKIEESKKNIEEKNELFKKRVRALYVNGNEGYLEILLSSDDFADFFARVESVIRIMEYDKKLIEGIESNKNELETQKAELEKTKKENVALKSKADSKYKELQGSSNEKKNLIASLEKDKASYLKMIEQEEQESQAIASIIKTIKKKKEEDAKRKAEEAKKKAEEDKKNQGNNTGTPSRGDTGEGSTSSEIGKLYCVTGRIYPYTSSYGWRIHPIFGTKKFHAGMDIGVPSGTSIYALADGEVIYSGVQTGYGNVVMIDHGKIISLYAHNSSLSVKVGQNVKGGQLIAKSGSTGYSTGPHLHFEIRNGSGQAISPYKYYVK